MVGLCPYKEAVDTLKLCEPVATEGMDDYGLGAYLSGDALGQARVKLLLDEDVAHPEPLGLVDELANLSGRGLFAVLLDDELPGAGLLGIVRERGGGR